MVDEKRNAIQVLLVEDHRVTLWGLQKLIEREKPRMEVVGSATNCTEALNLADKVFPDVIVLDMDRGEQDGLDSIPGLIAKSKAKVLIFTGLRDQSIHDDAVLAGASGIVEKKDPAETILKAIEKIHAGELWLNHNHAGRILHELSRKSAAKDGDPERRKMAILTPRERKVIAVIASNNGARHKAIAEMLHISGSTLRNHLTSIYGKLEVAGYLELFVYANKHGLNNPD